MKNVNVYQTGEEYALDESRVYPSISLVYDQENPELKAPMKKGCFIETTDGELIPRSKWDGSKTPNCIYCSDGVHKVRLALEWCNESNCEAVLATSNGATGASGTNTYKDDGQGTPFGVSWCRKYRWTSGYNSFVKWNELIDGISIYDTWDWEGRKNTNIIKKNFDIKNFPAFHACTSYTSPNGESGYLMSINEWQFVWGAFSEEIQAIDELLGLTNDNMYCDIGCPWSSSLCNEYGAWYLGTDDLGDLYGNSRYGNCCVRPAF